jgi:protein-disulfide isomerase-like protein with CxxC motif
MRCSVNATQNIRYRKGFSVTKRVLVQDICDFFGIERSEWDKLPPRYKTELRADFGDGSLTY